MTSLVTISIPEDFRERITAFCRERKLPVPGDLSITFLEPSLLGDIAGLQQKLQTFCLAQRDFNLVIGGPSVFNNQLLYLNVLPGYISIVRNSLVSHLKLQEGKSYRPHVTFVRNQPGHNLDMNRFQQEAAAVFSAPYNFLVSGLDLYTRKSETVPFKLQATIPFTGR